MELSLIIPAFIAGLLTFLAPCTLPLVPAYLGFISGTSAQELQNLETARVARRKIFLNGLFFIIGFSVLFILFGTAAGYAGSLLFQYRVWLTKIAGIFVILFGLFMLGILKLPFLAKERQLKLPPIFARGNPLNSFLIGLAFGFGWTPCVGPILGSILLIASTATTALQGAFLLGVFSAGLAIPFLVIAFGIGSASRHIERFGKYLGIVSVIGGLFLVFLGVLLFMNKLGLLVAWGYNIFRFIEYDKLLEYL